MAVKGRGEADREVGGFRLGKMQFTGAVGHPVQPFSDREIRRAENLKRFRRIAGVGRKNVCSGLRLPPCSGWR